MHFPWKYNFIKKFTFKEIFVSLIVLIFFQSCVTFFASCSSFLNLKYMYISNLYTIIVQQIRKTFYFSHDLFIIDDVSLFSSTFRLLLANNTCYHFDQFCYSVFYCCFSIFVRYCWY